MWPTGGQFVKKQHASVTGVEEDSGKLPVGAGGAVDMAVAHASKKSQKIKGKQP